MTFKTILISALVLAVLGFAVAAGLWVNRVSGAGYGYGYGAPPMTATYTPTVTPTVTPTP